MDARSCWISHVEGEIHPLCCLCPSPAAPRALTSALGLLAGRASVARAALAGAVSPTRTGSPLFWHVPQRQGLNSSRNSSRARFRCCRLVSMWPRLLLRRISWMSCSCGGWRWIAWKQFQLGINWDAVTLLDEFRTREELICLPRQLHVHHANVLLPQ